MGRLMTGGWLGFRMLDPRPDSSVVQLSLRYGFLDFFYQHLIIKPTLRLSALLTRTDYRVVDGLVDGFGVSIVVLAHITRVVDKLGLDGFINRLVWLVGLLGRLTRSVQNGRIQSYITAAVVGLLVVLWWIL